MLSLLQHARRRAAEALVQGVRENDVVQNGVQSATPFNLADWEEASTAKELNATLLMNWATKSRRDFEQVLDSISSSFESLSDAVRAIRCFPDAELNHLALQPAVQCWMAVYIQNLAGLSVTSIDGEPLRSEPEYITSLLERLKTGGLPYPRIHAADSWLRVAFGRTILFEQDAEVIKEATASVTVAFEIIEAWCPALLNEIRQLSPDIQFIHDPTAHPEKAVSFSDNSTPGALYVGVKVGGHLIDHYLLADSIIHEHRHQKLYLLQREVKLFEADTPLIKSPWREDLRPPSGLLHAIFVFVCLLEYWRHLATAASIEPQQQARAKGEVEDITRRLREAFPIMRSTRLTESGLEIVNVLESNFLKD